MYELWSAVQACVWFASRNNAAVSRLPENYTFAALAFYVELELIDSDDDDHTVVIDKGMTLGQLLGLRDQITEYLGPRKADRPGTAWIVRAQKQLLAACARGALKMTGRSLYGGPSREIPAEAFATFRFFERDGVDCLGPPDLVDTDCWRDLRLQADDVRRVWSADRSDDAASSLSTPAIDQRPPAEGEQPKEVEPKTAPTYASERRYYPDRVPEEFLEWAQEQHNAGVTITEVRALAAMREKLLPGVGLARRTVSAWIKTLPPNWFAKRGTPPPR